MVPCLAPEYDSGGRRRNNHRQRNGRGKLRRNLQDDQKEYANALRQRRLGYPRFALSSTMIISYQRRTMMCECE